MFDESCWLLVDASFWFTAEETAVYLSLDLDTVCLLIAQGKIPYFWVLGRGFRVEQEALDKILAAGNWPQRDALSILSGSTKTHPVKKPRYPSAAAARRLISLIGRAELGKK